MSTLFVNYQQAKRLTVLGFECDLCLGWYNGETLRVDVNASQTLKFHNHIRPSDTEMYIAPTFSQAFKFFREKSLYSTVHLSSSREERWKYQILAKDYFMEGLTVVNPWSVEFEQFVKDTVNTYKVVKEGDVPKFIIYSLSDTNPSIRIEYSTYEDSQSICLDTMIEFYMLIKNIQF